MSRIGFSNNQLKIIAMIAMTCDHVGKVLFPQYEILQIIGRLAYPIFAYMIAEGYLHTRSKIKYLLTISVFAIVCQWVYYSVTGGLYQNILITFMLSVLTIMCVDNFNSNKGFISGAVLILELAALVYVSVILPETLYGFAIDYGFIGVMLPVIIYIAQSRQNKLSALIIMLTLMSSVYGRMQWYSLLSVPLIMLYNGKRGKKNIKYMFYIFYPLHLAIIYLIDIYIPWI